MIYLKDTKSMKVGHGVRKRGKQGGLKKRRKKKKREGREEKTTLIFTKEGRRKKKEKSRWDKWKTKSCQNGGPKSAISTVVLNVN